jgi:hypothetical protein
VTIALHAADSQRPSLVQRLAMPILIERMNA